MRPPGLRTRKVSANTAGLSVERLITQLEITTSMVLAGSGIASMVPLRNSTLVAPAFSALARARASISSVMSSPYAFPVGPTRRAESRTSMPPPEPRSNTLSPSRSSATAVGLPQPREAATASAGRAARSSAA